MSYPRSWTLWALARLLKQARWDAAVTVEVAAHRAGVSATRMYAIEAGRALPTPKVAEGLCECYGMPVSVRAAVAGLVEDGAVEPWWWAERSVLPPGAGLALDMEAAASRIRYYDPVLPPGLLQTDAYAKALYTLHPGITADQVNRLVVLHQHRRALAEAGQPRLDVIVDESVVQRLAAAPGIVHARQFKYLLTGGSAIARTVRSLPTATGPHSGCVVGGFTIFDFPDLAEGVSAPTIVYHPHTDGAVFHDTDETVAPYLDIWAVLAAITERQHLERLGLLTDPRP